MSEEKRSPKRILLATDLSPRCDRALDRVVRLAAVWDASLTVVHAIEGDNDAEIARRLPSWGRTDPTTIVIRQLQRDLAGRPVKVIVEKGEPAEIVHRTAEMDGSELVVVGLARDEFFGRFRLGATVDWLLRRTNAPLLVVRQRPYSSYENILVTSDFSESSRHAFDIANAFFPAAAVKLFHAYDAPLADATRGLATPESAQHIASIRAMEFLRASAITEPRRSEVAVVESGDPAELVQKYVYDKSVDLVVLGTQGRSAFVDFFVGSVAKSILATLPCDALIVRATRHQHGR